MRDQSHPGHSAEESDIAFAGDPERKNLRADRATSQAVLFRCRQYLHAWLLECHGQKASYHSQTRNPARKISCRAQPQAQWKLSRSNWKSVDFAGTSERMPSLQNIVGAAREERWDDSSQQYQNYPRLENKEPPGLP